MKETIQIRLYADSLGLPRKGVVQDNERYIRRVADWVEEKYSRKVRLIDRSKPNSLITQLFENYKEDESYFDECDIMILHEGVCDCAPRPLPIRVRNIISRLPTYIRNKVVKFIHDNRAHLLKRGFRFVLTKEALFYSTYVKFLSELKDKPIRVFVFNIAPTNSEVEKHSPGFAKNIETYNGLIKKAIDFVEAKNIVFINMYAVLVSQNHLDEYVIKEDGHHITSKAHELYFENVINNLTF